MPSKRKRSGAGFNRDDPSQAKRPAYHQPYRVASRNISGPGIFVTCVQGKERKAALQFIDILNEVADRLYPGVLPQPLKEEEKEVVVEEDEDALRNGAPTIREGLEEQGGSVEQGAAGSTEPAEQQKVKDKREEKREENGDIASQIAAELNSIKASESKRGKKKDGLVRFRNIETDTECFLFISVSPPFDPYLLVYTILSDTEASGEPRSRFIQRLTPVSSTTLANPDSLTSLSRSILPRYFPPTGPGRTFKIDPRIRSHSKLKRGEVIQIVASSIPTGEGGERVHNANLTSPDLWVVVEVVKNSAAIGVVGEYERWKKMNLQSVALGANERRAIQGEREGEGEDGGRIKASLVSKAVLSEEVGTKEGVNGQAKKEEGVVVEKADAVEAQNEAESTAQPTEGEQMANFRLF